MPSVMPAVRAFSSTGSSDSKIRVPFHLLFFSTLMLPVLGYTLYAGRYGPSQEELQKEIRERYASRQEESRERSKRIGEFFQEAVYNPNGKHEDTLKGLLYAGRGEKQKRLHAVDEKLLGTEEGVAEKKRQEELRKKREEYKRKKKAGEIVDDKPKGKNAKKTAAGSKDEPNPLDSDSKSSVGEKGMAINVQSAAAMGAVALLAAGVGFLAGGSRRS